MTRRLSWKPLLIGTAVVFLVVVAILVVGLIGSRHPPVTELLDGAAATADRQRAVDQVTNGTDNLIDVPGLTLSGTDVGVTCWVNPGAFAQGRTVDCDARSSRYYGFKGEFSQMRKQVLSALDQQCGTQRHDGFSGWGAWSKGDGVTERSWQCNGLVGLPPMGNSATPPFLYVDATWHQAEDISTSFSTSRDCSKGTPSDEDRDGGYRCIAQVNRADLTKKLNGSEFVLVIESVARFYEGRKG